MALHADEALAAARTRLRRLLAAAHPWPRQTSPQSSSWLLISASSRPRGALRMWPRPTRLATRCAPSSLATTGLTIGAAIP